MDKKVRMLSWRRLVPLEILVGIVLLVIVFFISANADIAAAETQLTATVEYMKQQCNSSQLRDLASEAKSLVRVSESVDLVRWKLEYDGETDDYDAAALETLASESYLSGIVLLSAEGAVRSSFDAAGLTTDELLAQLDTAAVLDTAEFPEKTYAARIVRPDGGHLDVAAIGRGGGLGVVLGYYVTSAAYTQTFNDSIRSLVNGYFTQHDGVIVISSGNRIIASNDASLVGQNTEDVPILSRIMTRASGTKLIHAHGTAHALSHDFGLMEKSQNYYVYAYMTERDVFSTTPRSMLYVLFAYVLVIILLRMLLWRTERVYADRQMADQQAYTEKLEEKNGQLRRAVAEAEEANAAKSRFLSRMSHDIRTPLNGIIGLLKIDETHFQDPKLVLENHEKMLVSANHLLSLINDVLQMGKLEDGKVELTHEPISLAELSRDVGTIIGTRTVEAGITFTVKRQELPVEYVYGSPLHLRQVFLNVYGNCVKYNHRGGSVETTTECLGVENGVVTYRWTITDTGVGMSEEFLQHMFEPFAQERSDARTVYAGTGLGMTIVKSLIDLMGGTIEVKSREGVGSTFIITLPFDVAPQPAALPEAAEPEEASIRGMHFLMAEDNSLNAEIAELLLADEGASVTTVTDGSQAVARFEESAPGEFDAILMDVMMPVMDGLAATRAIRALDRPDAKTIPVVAMTANAFDEDARQCLAAGMNAHLAKPLYMKAVKETLARLCGRK